MTRSQAATQLSAYFVHQLAEDPGFDRGLLQAVDVLLGETMPDEQGKGDAEQGLALLLILVEFGPAAIGEWQFWRPRLRALVQTLRPFPEAVPPPVEQEYKPDIIVIGVVRRRAATIQRELAEIDATLRREGYAPLSPSPALAGRQPLPDHDNHHNALACPYCNPNGRLVDSSARAGTDREDT